MYRGEGKKKNFENMKKKFQSPLFNTPGRWTENNFLFKGGPIPLSAVIQYDNIKL